MPSPNNSGPMYTAIIATFLSILGAVTAPLYSQLSEIDKLKNILREHEMREGHGPIIEKVATNKRDIMDLDLRLQREFGLIKDLIDSQLKDLERRVNNEIRQRERSTSALIKMIEQRIDRNITAIERIQNDNNHNNVPKLP